MSTHDNRDNERSLFYLNELSDYKVKDEDPDIRNWDIYDKDNSRIGKVDNLLVSKDSERVRYVDVEVDKNIINENHEPYAHEGANKPHEFVNKDGDNHLIVPVEMIRLNDKEKRAYCDGVSKGTFARTKRIPKGQPVNSEYEDYVMHTYKTRDVGTSHNINEGRPYTSAQSGSSEDRSIQGNRNSPEPRGSQEMRQAESKNNPDSNDAGSDNADGRDLIR